MRSLWASRHALPLCLAVLAIATSGCARTPEHKGTQATAPESPAAQWIHDALTSDRLAVGCAPWQGDIVRARRIARIEAQAELARQQASTRIVARTTVEKTASHGTSETSVTRRSIAETAAVIRRWRVTEEGIVALSGQPHYCVTLGAASVDAAVSGGTP